MPDWKKLVRERLVMSTLPPTCGEEIIEELATHLEEIYAMARSEGMAEDSAVGLALQEVKDWRVLAARIERARSKEGLVNARTKYLWLPSLFTLSGSSISLALIQLAGIHPRLVWTGHAAMCFYWPWLLTLPLFGALGAHLSQRASGSTLARLAAASSPALVMLITMLLVLPFGLAIDGFSFLRFIYFGIALMNWVALPAVALLVGAVPFLRESGDTALKPA